MNGSSKKMLDELMEDAKPKPPPEPEPDFTGWTHKEINDWHQTRLAKMAPEEFFALMRAANKEAPPSQEPPTPREQFDAEDARDAAILAERAAKAAAERLAERPGTAALQVNARATREAADKALRAAEEAERLAEDAKRRPPPATNPDAPGPGAAAVQPSPKPQPPPPPHPELKPEPERPPEPKQWWEERAKWRHRSPAEEADLRRGHPLYQCLVDYDPIEWFKAEREGRDYDPDD